MEQQVKKSIFKKWWFWVIIIGIIGSLFSGTKTQPTPTQTTTQPVQTTTESTPEKVSVGEEGYVNVPSPKAIIALTESDFNELSKIYLANDMTGVYEFLVSGKGFAVPNGTKVLVIDSAVGSHKVRILEGDSIGQAGWIVMEWISKTKSKI